MELFIGALIVLLGVVVIYLAATGKLTAVGKAIAPSTAKAA